MITQIFLYRQFKLGEILLQINKYCVSRDYSWKYNNYAGLSMGVLSLMIDMYFRRLGSKNYLLFTAYNSGTNSDYNSLLMQWLGLCDKC